MAKYPFNSPYAFSENRVIDGIELEGLEVVNVHEKSDPAIYKHGMNNKDQSAVHIYGHGTPSNMYVPEFGWTNKKEAFQAMLDRSTVYTTRKEGEETVVIIHSCRVGRSYYDEKGVYVPSIAERWSAEFPDLTIIAPDERCNFLVSRELGPLKISNAKNNRGDPVGDQDAITIAEYGKWNVFEGGKLVGAYSGADYNGSTAPSGWMKFWNFVANPNPQTTPADVPDQAEEPAIGKLKKN